MTAIDSTDINVLWAEMLFIGWMFLLVHALIEIGKQLKRIADKMEKP